MPHKTTFFVIVSGLLLLATFGCTATSGIEIKILEISPVLTPEAVAPSSLNPITPPAPTDALGEFSDRARADLAGRLGVDQSLIKLESVQTTLLPLETVFCLPSDKGAALAGERVIVIGPEGEKFERPADGEAIQAAIENVEKVQGTVMTLAVNGQTYHYYIVAGALISCP